MHAHLLNAASNTTNGGLVCIGPKVGRQTVGPQLYIIIEETDNVPGGLTYPKISRPRQTSPLIYEIGQPLIAGVIHSLFVLLLPHLIRLIDDDNLPTNRELWKDLPKNAPQRARAVTGGQDNGDGRKSR